MAQRKELNISVSEQTVNELEKASKEMGLSIGETVDRLMLLAAPDNSNEAFLNIMEQIIIGMTRLSKRDVAKVFGEIGAIFLMAAPPMELDIIVAAIKRQRAAGTYRVEAMTSEERFYYIESLRDTLFPKEKGTYRPEK